MKIGILTHYTVINNGATLQMYALSNYLKSLGHDVFILTYDKNYDFDEDAGKKYSGSLKNLFFYLDYYLFKRGVGLFFTKVKKQFIFKKFIKKNFKFLPYETDLDAVFVGSDEVFSLECGCNKMMYGHGVNAKKIISYAPSFGQTSLDLIKERNCYDIIKSGLKKFTSLSVRDINTQKIVEHFIDSNVEIVCYPVLLFDFKDVHTNIKKPRNKYILLYSYDKNMNDKNEIAAIKKYAASKHLKVYSIGTYHKWCDKNIICDPLQWIDYFRFAEEVITDTFHGSVLSIITNREALYYARNINSNKMTSLLGQFNLLDRMVKNITYEELSEKSNNSVDFDYVNKTLYVLRKTSGNYVKNSLK